MGGCRRLVCRIGSWRLRDGWLVVGEWGGGWRVGWWLESGGGGWRVGVVVGFCWMVFGSFLRWFKEKVLMVVEGCLVAGCDDAFDDDWWC